MTKIQRTACFLALAALLAVALVLTLAAPGAAVAPVAPKFLELGKGPTIVIVHDMGGNRMGWMPTARKLVGKYHVVLVDLPGHGDSALPDPFTLETAAEALDQVLMKQNPDSTVIVGKGMGGMLTLLDLKAHPNRARGLVLVESPLKSPLKIDDQDIQYFVRQMDANYDAILKMLFLRAGRDSVQGVAIHATAAQVQPAAIKKYIEATLRADATSAMKALQVPYLVVATERLFKDGKTSGAALRAMGYEDTTVTVRRIANAGYMVMQDQPDTLAAVIADFTNRAIAAKKK